MSNLTDAAKAVKENPTDNNIVNLIIESARVGDEVGFGGNKRWYDQVDEVRDSLFSLPVPVPEPEPAPEP